MSNHLSSSFSVRDMNEVPHLFQDSHIWRMKQHLCNSLSRFIVKGDLLRISGLLGLTQSDILFSSALMVRWVNGCKCAFGMSEGFTFWNLGHAVHHQRISPRIPAQQNRTIIQLSVLFYPKTCHQLAVSRQKKTFSDGFLALKAECCLLMVVCLESFVFN